ncbi:MAG TPA: division/cell wall cluster transcriptional repressor MraZ [Polyangiaceae bacterium]|jgi:MraZ protein|nr:division/cell wall cluster transcriptional repressor MraZ [Polyangiaceae bacterium]
MFRGRYEHTIDQKGRTSLPAKYREVLAAIGERRIVLTSSLDPCLVAYTMPEWLGFEEKISKLSQFDRAVQKLRRIYVSGAVECEVDDSGRVLVPPTLRDHGKLSKEVLWAGAGRYAELWDKQMWRDHTEIASDEERAQMAARLAELGL